MAPKLQQLTAEVLIHTKEYNYEKKSPLGAPLSLELALGAVLCSPVLRAQTQNVPAGQEDQQKTGGFRR